MRERDRENKDVSMPGCVTYYIFIKTLLFFAILYKGISGIRFKSPINTGPAPSNWFNYRRGLFDGIDNEVTIILLNKC